MSVSQINPRTNIYILEHTSCSLPLWQNVSSINQKHSKALKIFFQQNKIVKRKIILSRTWLMSHRSLAKGELARSPGQRRSFEFEGYVIRERRRGNLLRAFTHPTVLTFLFILFYFRFSPFFSQFGSQSHLYFFNYTSSLVV